MTTLAPSFLIGSSLLLQVMMTTIIAQMGLKFGKMGQGTEEYDAPERLKNSPLTKNGRNLVTTLVRSFFDESSSFLHVTRTLP